MTNSDLINEQEAGVRTNGSSLQRRLDLHEAQNGGVDTATMFVKAGRTTGARIEVYAEDDLDVDFYLVGYWSPAPRAYREKFVDIGSPSASNTWQDVDLSSFNVPKYSVVELALANGVVGAEHQMGVRANGSSLLRILDLHQAKDGGGDFGRMHVTSDVGAVIEFNHEQITDPHNFFMTGYWRPPPPSIISWKEVEPN